jgi:hypothetical protein
MRPMRLQRTLSLAVLAILCTGCAQWSWNPAKWFREPAPAAAAEVQVLTIDSTSGGGDRFVQSWDGARLVVDVHSAGGSGTALLKPVEGQSWPLRLAFRVHSSGLAEFEARGAQVLRMSFGSEPLTEPALIDLPYGIYRKESPQLEIRWLGNYR